MITAKEAREKTATKEEVLKDELNYVNSSIGTATKQGLSSTEVIFNDSDIRMAVANNLRNLDYDVEFVNEKVLKVKW